MRKSRKKTETYRIGLSELLKALDIKITKSKVIRLSCDMDIDKGLPYLDIEVSKE